MDIRHICPGCMGEKGDAVVCPQCGYNEAEAPESAIFLPPGTILNGRYLIGRVLGYGGFGITYLALDLNLDLKMAVKEFLPQTLATRTAGNTAISVYSGNAKEYFGYGLDKFIDEARTLARFNSHPCIVSVTDFFKENQTAYLVMEYIDGITFKDYLERKGGRVPLETALEVMNPVMDALREVHSASVLHRDISPDNIYITAKKQVKLLDFGAARYAMGEQSKSLSVVLKPGFAPWEQYHSKGVQGPWTDVYATAATIYRAITGMVPPESASRVEEDTLQLPSQLGVLIDPRVEMALIRALAVKSKDRIQSIVEFQNALKNTTGTWETPRNLGRTEPLPVVPPPGPVPYQGNVQAPPEKQALARSHKGWLIAGVVFSVVITFFAGIALVILIMANTNRTSDSRVSSGYTDQTDGDSSPSDETDESASQDDSEKFIQSKNDFNQRIGELAERINTAMEEDGDLSDSSIHDDCQALLDEEKSVLDDLNSNYMGDIKEHLVRLFELEIARTEALLEGVSAAENGEDAQPAFQRGADAKQEFDQLDNE